MTDASIRIELPEFRCQVAEALCFASEGGLKRVGRPTNTPEPIRKKSRHIAQIPCDDVRYDGMQHWCKFLDRKGKKSCKFKGCTSETQAFCAKCELNLCNAPGKDCFLKFHTK